MIYQLKISLQRTTPPIWRRILVHKDISLFELHEIIQIAFEWAGMHLHCFEPRKTNGLNLTDHRISIGVQDEDDIDLFEYDYEEDEEKLSDWLIKEKDKLVYIYDFGDDWCHDIVLEKVLQPETGKSYPFCVKAMRAPAKEDRGAFAYESEEVDGKELQLDINEAFQHIAKEVNYAGSSIEQNSDGGWKRLIELAKEYNELAPWRWLDDDQIIAVQIPQTGELAYCSVMGVMGEEFGLAAFVGDEGLAYLHELIETDRGTIYGNRSLALMMCDRDELAEEDYALLKQEGFTFRGKNQWPMFRSLVPGYYPWVLSNDEVEWFSVILERMIEVCSRAKEGLEIFEFDGNDMCFAQIILDRQKKTWQDAHLSVVIDRVPVEPSKFLVSELDLRRVKSLKKRFNVPLEIGSFHTPQPVQDHPTEKPYFPICFVGAERNMQMVVFTSVFAPENKEQGTQSAFIDMINTLQAIPREVWLTSEMYLILKPILNELKINAIQVERLPIIEEVQESMFNLR